MLALRLDASQPAHFAPLASDLVAAYLAYSMVLAALAWLKTALARRAALLCHAFDLAMFGAVNLITEGAASPFFVFFVFALVSAALRWQWRGTLTTAAVLLAMFLALGLYSARPGQGFEFELNRFVIRSVYLAVVAVLLGYLGDHERRQRHQAARVAAAEERMKMARDLHDGVIQGLTGASLKLQAIRGSVADDSTARRTLADVQQLLAGEQRELRAFMSELGAASEPGLGDWRRSLRDLPGKLARHWNLRVDLSDELEARLPPPELGRQIYRIAHEALVNSARHGSAGRARVELGYDRDEVVLAVIDDGGGFPFEGEFDLEQLDRLEIGPRSLKERVRALGGDLKLSTGSAGTRLDIRLPAPGGGA